MPRKSNNIKPVDEHLEKKLQKRLMEINLRLYDYIYAQRDISVVGARAYIYEVTSYKKDCIGNERLIQEIEKLIRCMSGIIDEKQEQYSTGNGTTYSEQSCPSPVYSLPDEDRVLLTQAASKSQEMFDDTYNSHNFQLHRQEPHNNIRENSIQPIETIDLCEDDDLIINVDVEVHRAMSNLSLNEIENTQVFEPSQNILDCFETEAWQILQTTEDTDANTSHNPNASDYDELQSQSILNEYEVNVTPQNDISKELITSNVELNITKQIDGKQDSLIQRVKKNVLKEQDLTKTPNNKEKTVNPGENMAKFVTPFLAKPDEKLNIKEKKTVAIKKKRGPKTKGNIPKAPRRKKNTNTEGLKEEKNSMKLLKTSGTLTKVRRRKKSTKTDGLDGQKNHTQFSEPENINKKDAVVTSNSKKLAKSNQCDNIVSISVNIPKETKGPISHDDGNQVVKGTKIDNKKETIPPIYNKRVEDDLSWLENIRYVREITSDEFDPKLANIEDSFWDNLVFPSDWNDQDFKVY